MRVSGCALVRTPPCVRVGVPWACVPPEVYGAVGGGGWYPAASMSVCAGERAPRCAPACARERVRGAACLRVPGRGCPRPLAPPGLRVPVPLLHPLSPRPPAPPRPAAGRRGGDETPSGFRRAPPGLGAGAGRGDGRPRRPQLLVRLVRRRPGEGEPRRPLLRPRGCGSGAVGAGRCPRRPWGWGRAAGGGGGSALSAGRCPPAGGAAAAPGALPAEDGPETPAPAVLRPHGQAGCR